MACKRHLRRSQAASAARLASLEHLEQRRLLAADLHDSSLALAAEFAPPAAGESSAALSANLAAMNVAEAWAAGHTGRGVVVAVVDSGVALSHPGLAANLWSNPGEVPGNGVDDDGNGFVDDVSGWDFAGGDNRPDDPNGHGTHIAGTISGSGEIRGVAPEARLMPVRVLDGLIRGSNADIAAGIRYAVDSGADIINLSVGGANNATIQRALEYAERHDVLVVAAAGNTKGAAPLYPAAHSAALANVLSVGAIGLRGELAQFSSRVAGSGAVQVDAPGQDIRSTFVAAPYGYQSGTSMAAPHVAGLAALALAANPELSAAELRNLIVQGARRSVSGSDARGGIDAAATLELVMAGRRAIAPAPRTEAVVSEIEVIALPLVESSPPPPLPETDAAAVSESAAVQERVRSLARANVAAENERRAHDRAVLAWWQSGSAWELVQLQHWSRQENESNDADWFERGFGFAQLSAGRRLPTGFTRA